MRSGPPQPAPLLLSSPLAGPLGTTGPQGELKSEGQATQQVLNNCSLDDRELLSLCSSPILTALLETVPVGTDSGSGPGLEPLKSPSHAHIPQRQGSRVTMRQSFCPQPSGRQVERHPRHVSHSSQCWGLRRGVTITSCPGTTRVRPGRNFQADKV